MCGRGVDGDSSDVGVVLGVNDDAGDAIVDRARTLLNDNNDVRCICADGNVCGVRCMCDDGDVRDVEYACNTCCMVTDSCADDADDDDGDDVGNFLFLVCVIIC